MENLKLNMNKDQEYDVVINEDGQLEWVSDHEYIQQKVKQVLLLVKGEWFRDNTKGIPYFTQIFVKPIDLNKIRIILRSALESDDTLKSLGVQKYEFTNFQIDPQKRSIKCILNIILSDGTSITLKDGFSL